jgi:hypothetical protein
MNGPDVEKRHHPRIPIVVKDPEPFDRLQCYKEIALPFWDER